jgi:signal peptidase
LGDGLIEYAKYFTFFVVLAVALFGGVHVLKLTLKTQYPIMVVVSGSMVPTLEVGDFILVDHIDEFGDVVAAPNPEGDIIVFLRSTSSDEYIVHRAVEKFNRSGIRWFVTKGDHNPVEDAQPVKEGNVMGKVIYRVPVLGYFPLLIKTSRGFILVAGLMAIVFFADYLMPDKRNARPGGRFPWLMLIPFMLGPLVCLAFWFVSDFHKELELLTLASWYVGCLLAPFAFDDDDAGLMFWLYHFVLIMIPLGCDLVRWITWITPSLWWEGEASTMPITWLLQKETAMFHQAFNKLALLLIPGCVLFLSVMAVKRRGVQQLTTLNKRMRGVSGDEQLVR